jgi:hypothetical protein
MSDLVERARKAQEPDKRGNFARYSGLIKDLADEIERLTAALEASQAGGLYVRRELAAEREKLARLREALRWFDKHESTIKSDINSAHSGRGDAASDWMREDDRDFRRDLCEAFARARAALGDTK